ncbi:MAG: hypothetical protein AABY22_14370 [Nanoarchaeota archaeon]
MTTQKPTIEIELMKRNSLTLEVHEAIQNTLKELEKKRQCQNGYPHVCKKHPGDCDYIYFESDVQEAFGKVK